MSGTPLLVPSETCWRIATAERAAFLVDADAYYTAMRAAMLRARRKIRIIGWDVDSRTRLGPDAAPADGLPATLLPFLNALLDRRPALTVDVLAWDFSMIYTFEREPLPQVRFGWQGHKRLRFSLDGAHPPGASQHQKVVVIDDRVAFTGGIDLTIRRWDTPEHGSADRRRVDPGGAPYHPMHDVGIAVDGELAGALAELARQRWESATGRAPDEGVAGDEDVWPAGLEPDVRGARFGIARTLGPMSGAATPGRPPEVREIERLTVAAIERARRSILIENQYLTASVVGVALARRLEQPDGPEVVVVVPQVESGWLERGSMGVLRGRLLAKLQQADRHGRLRVLHPVVPGDRGPVAVGVHSKLLFVDDGFCKLGSANMSNRSMALDTECDLALEAALPGNDEAAVTAAIVGLRARLLAEHLGRAPAEVLERHAATGSLTATIEALTGGDRRLEPLREVPEAPVDLALLDGFVCDPEKPLVPEALLDELVPHELKRPTWRALRAWIGVVVALLAVGALWRVPGVRELASLDRLAAWGRTLESSSGGVWLCLLAYVAAAVAFAPITLLITATALVLDPWRAFAVAYVGGVVAACASYWIGRAIGARALHRFLSPRMLKLRSHIRRGGFLTITAARLLPVGNFGVINVVAGALVVPFGGFVAGNVVGLLPGTLLLSLLADRLSSAVAHPSAANVAAFVVVAVAVGFIVARVRRVLRGGRFAARSLHGGPQES